MKSVRGRITVAQELRFQLVDDQGRTLLFAISHAAPIEPQDLQRLARGATPVQVHYTETDTLNGHAAEATFVLASDTMPSGSKKETHP